MYFIAWIDRNDQSQWDWVSGEDARDVFISELVDEHNVLPEDIHVFDADDEIR